MDDGAEAFYALAIALFAFALVIFVSVIAAIVWLAIAAVLATIRREHLRKQALERYDQVILDEGIDIPVDEVLRAMSIAGVDPGSDGYDEFDILSGTVFGVGEAYE